ncbi:GNAT family N-acetyltransferase [Paenibacillus spongiae]|uniref:GNAT family N-acetyltransferase n=2 Tax=Paenibacillus spongiae TaxID=2909671 RepID=A0ABY5S6S7_9BACL|nr:GNAT family N-acetyltransferase [Paenibacillus spongiae]UVI29419.1 GNAT family N-acetyltransferase [Paenibacillus spongiae]
MYPKGIYPLTAEQLEQAARTRIKPTVILYGDQVVGYCNFIEITGDSSWLGNVIIHPSYRGMGVGKYLIETMKETARSELRVTNFRLLCHSTNTDALLFYTKLGFKPFDSNIQQDHEGKPIVGIKMEVAL